MSSEVKSTRALNAEVVIPYLLGLEIQYGLNEFSRLVEDFQHTSDDELVVRMDNWAKRLPLLIKEFNTLGRGLPECKDAFEFLNRTTERDLTSNLASLDSIHRDPNVYIDPVFTAYEGVGPKDMLDRILQSAKDKEGGTALTDAQRVSFVFQLYCSDLYDEIIDDLFSFYSDEKPLSHLDAEETLAKLQADIDANPDVRKYSANVLEAFKNLVGTMEDLGGMESQEMSDSDDYEGTTYFRQLNQALSGITNAIAILRVDLLQDFAAAG